MPSRRGGRARPGAATLSALALGGLVLGGMGAADGSAPVRPADADLPGARLAERLEEAFSRRAGVLRWKHLEHYARVAPVEPADLERVLAPVSARPDGRGFVLGVGHTAELHGGAILGFLFAHWRPEGRPARPADRFPFRSGPLALESIYAGHRRQVFLPVPGRSADEIAGAIPDPAQLARMRFFGDVAGVAPVERDAYAFLRLLVDRERELDARWANHLGQELSVDLLLGQARESYLRETDPGAEQDDHSRLHLVEILLAYERRSRREGSAAPPDPEPVKRRFLAVELGRPVAQTDDERLVHYAESLGWLVAHPGLHWSEAEKARARTWLGELEDRRFTDLDRLEDTHLTHLLKGLRTVGTHADRLRPRRR